MACSAWLFDLVAAFEQSSQFDRCTLLVIVDVDIRLRRRNVPVTGQRHQHTDADTFTGKVCDERPTTGMTRCTLDANCAVQVKAAKKRKKLTADASNGKLLPQHLSSL